MTAYWRDPHLEEVNLRYMQQQTRSEIVHIACRIGNENCATQVNCSFELHNTAVNITSNIIQWTHVMTPTGVCNVLRLDYITEDQAENTLR